MELTVEILEIIEDKLWKNLEELNKDEKKWIEHGNSSHYSMCHFSDSYRYISCINLLKGLRKVVGDDKNYINYYGLKELETEEDKPYLVSLNYHIKDNGAIIIDTTHNTFHIPPYYFEAMVKEAIKEGFLHISFSLPDYEGNLEEAMCIKMKPKTEEENK